MDQKDSLMVLTSNDDLLAGGTQEDVEVAKAESKATITKAESEHDGMSSPEKKYSFHPTVERKSSRQAMDALDESVLTERQSQGSRSSRTSRLSRISRISKMIAPNVSISEIAAEMRRHSLEERAKHRQLTFTEDATIDPDAAVDVKSSDPVLKMPESRDKMVYLPGISETQNVDEIMAAQAARDVEALRKSQYQANARDVIAQTRTGLFVRDVASGWHAGVYEGALIKRVVSVGDVASTQILNRLSMDEENREVSITKPEHNSRIRVKAFKYNSEYNYVGDVERPTLFERQLTFTEDPLWYNLNRCIIFVLIILLCFDIPDLDNVQDATNAINVAMYVFYVVDIALSFFTQHILKLVVVEPNPTAKPVWVFALEIFAIAPVEYFVTSEPDSKIWFLLRAKSVLLIIRLVYEYMLSSLLLETTMLARVFEMVMVSTCLRIFFGSICFNVLLLKPSKDFINVFDVKSSLRVYSERLEIWQEEIPVIIDFYLVNMIVYAPSVCLLMFTYTLNNYAKYSYISHVHLFTKTVMPRYRITPENGRRVMEYMELNWKQRHNYMLMEAAVVENICCRTTYEAMRRDRNLYALQHCPMLRDLDFYVLRYLAQIITPRYYLGDKYLYKFPMRKTSMFYIASGEVNILSKEDGTSAIFKLTAGTCVGTTCLIHPYRTHSNFRTATPCEIYEMKTCDFVRLASDFPSEYRTCFRYMQAKIDQAILLKRVKKDNDPKAAAQNIIWMKRHLHRLMSLQAENPSDHRVTNIYMMKALNRGDERNEVLYTKMNMTALCIQARESQYTDSVFIKPSCLWVLHPNSPLLRFMWKLMFINSMLTYVIIIYEFVLGRSGVLSIIHAAGIVFMVLDISILCMTPIDLDMSRKIYNVFAERCKMLGFVFDIVSTCTSVTFMVSDFDIGLWIMPLMALRLWRLKEMYDYIENNVVSFLFACQISFYVTLYIFIWYNVGLVFIYLDRSNTHIFSYEAMMFTVGQGLYNVATNTDYPYAYSIPQYCLFLLQMVIGTSIASSYHLKKYDSISIASTLASTQRYINSATVQKTNLSLTLRLHSYLTLLINDFDYLQIKHSKQRFVKYPDYIDIISKPDRLFKYLNRSQFLSKFPKQLVKELITCCVIETFYENAIVLARGVKYDSFHVLIDGQVCSVELDQVTRIERAADLNCIEVVFDMPAVRNFVAFSHVITAAIPYAKFLQIMLKFPSTHKTYLRAVESFRDHAKEALTLILFGKPMVIIEVNREPELVSFFKFHCVMYRDSFEAYDYFTPFDQLGIFSFVRFLLLRCTFHPEGSFFLRWERFRVSCACVCIVIFLLPSYLQAPIENYLLAFDIVGYVDIYLRFHVCYYNAAGIMVKHPLKTARHYINRAFLIDLLSVMPLQFYSRFTMFRTMVKSCRAIQLYRVIGYNHYAFNEHYAFAIVGIIYITVVIVVALSTLLFEFDCTESTMAELKCAQLDDTSPIRSYISLLMFTTSAITGAFFHMGLDAKSMNSWTHRALAISCLLGFFWRALCLARAFNMFMAHDVYVNKLRTDIRKLINFMRHNGLPKILRNHVIDYFEVQWKWFDSYRCQEVVQNMNVSLRRDFLFHIYGDPYIRFNSFTSDYRNLVDFYKNVMLHASVKICPTYGRFVSVNDVDSAIYFIYRGVVEICGPDGVPITTLLPGGIFGNLSALRDTRQKINATARCNAQCLYLQSAKLYEILEHFPKIKSHFVRAMHKNAWFIKSKAKSYMYYRNLTTGQRRQYLLMKAILLFHTIAVLYLDNLLNFYQIATGEEDVSFLNILYALDGIHVIAQFIEFLTPTKDEFGYWCLDLRDLLVLKSSKWTLIMAGVTTVPIDLVVHFQGPFPNRTYWYSALRCNRVVRMYYIMRTYLELMSHSGSRVTLWHKTLIIFYEVMYFSFFITTLFALVDPIATYYFRDSTLLGAKGVPDEVINLRSLPPADKCRYFVNYLAFSMVLVVQENDKNTQVQSPVMQVMMPICMIMCFIMYILVLCQFFDIISDIYSRKAFVATIMFHNMLKYSTSYSDFIKKRIIINARYVYSKDKIRATRALQRSFTPLYLVEMVLNSAYGHFLTRHPIFRYCHPDFLRQVGKQFKVVDIPKSFEVIHRYDNRRCMFFLLRGSVVVLQEDGDILDNYLYLLKPGDCFCFQLGFGMCKQSAYNFTCRESSTILELELDSWQYLTRYFPATKKIIEEQCQRFMKEPYLAVPLPPTTARRLGMKYVLKKHVATFRALKRKLKTMTKTPKTKQERKQQRLENKALRQERKLEKPKRCFLRRGNGEKKKFVKADNYKVVDERLGRRQDTIQEDRDWRQRKRKRDKLDKKEQRLTEMIEKSELARARKERKRVMKDINQAADTSTEPKPKKRKKMTKQELAKEQEEKSREEKLYREERARDLQMQRVQRLNDAKKLLMEKRERKS